MESVAQNWSRSGDEEKVVGRRGRPRLTQGKKPVPENFPGVLFGNREISDIGCWMGRERLIGIGKRGFWPIKGDWVRRGRPKRVVSEVTVNMRTYRSQSWHINLYFKRKQRMGW